MNAKCRLFSLWTSAAAASFVLPLPVSADQQPIEQTLFEQLQDINPCTGRQISEGLMQPLRSQ